MNEYHISLKGSVRNPFTLERRAQKRIVMDGSLEELWEELEKSSSSNLKVWTFNSESDPDLVHVKVYRNVPDSATDSTRKSITEIVWSQSKCKKVFSATVPLGTDVVAVSPSRCGRLLAVFSSGGVGKSPCIDIWNENVFEKRIPVDSVHGNFITASRLGNFSWNKTSESIVYVAERQSSTSQSQSYPYIEDWGEGLANISWPSIFICNVQDGSIKEIVSSDSEYQDMSFGQPCFDPEGTCIVFLGWPNSRPWKLGIAYCFNRPCNLLCAPLSSITLSNDGLRYSLRFFALTEDDGSSYRDPVFSNNQASTKLAFFG